MPLLEHSRIFRSRDPEDACAFLESKQFRFSFSRKAIKQLDLRINGIYFPSVYLGYIQYGSPAEIETSPARDDYWLQIPIQENLEITVGRHCIDCSPRRAAVSSPTNRLRIRTVNSGARFNISLNPSALIRELAGLLGDAPGAQLEFAPEMDLATGHGHALARYVWFAIADFEKAGMVMWDAPTISLFEQFVICRMLLSHPNNYTGPLLRRERLLTPRDMRRAIDYMHTNVVAPITIADIAEASGIAGRTLFQYFRDFGGTTPMRYLRDVRFDKVRDALRQARPEEGVAEIASKWGFSHMGRFAVEYRKRFGESPSQTLQTPLRH
jgi:AraC-like DNA-binding protein